LQGVRKYPLWYYKVSDIYENHKWSPGFIINGRFLENFKTNICKFKKYRTKILDVDNVKLPPASII
jgi:hypothetical protein